MEYDVPHLSALLDRSVEKLVGQLEDVPWYEEEDIKIQKVEAVERAAAQLPFLASGRVFCRVQEVTSGIQARLTRLLIDDSNRRYPDYDDDPRIVALVEDFPDSVLPETVAKTIRTGIALQRLFPTSVEADAVLLWAQEASVPLHAIMESGNRCILTHNEVIRNVSDQYKGTIRRATLLNAELNDVIW
jgi:hypothetical protein